MRSLKKLMTVVVAGIAAASMTLTAFAASGISASEQKILDKVASVKSGYTMSTAQEKKFNDVVAQAKSYLESHELSDAQVTTVLGAIDDAATAVAAAAPNGDISALTADQLSALASKVASALQAGADAAGIKITISADGTFTVKSETTGKTVASSSNTVKATGVAVNTTAAVVATLVVALAGCAVFAKKKRLFVA